MTAEAERVTIDVAESILGLKRRNIESKSDRGEIPGAVKLGRLWTYDPVRLRRYVKQEEERQWRERVQKHRPAVSGRVTRSMAGRALRGGSSDGHLKRTIQKLQQNVAKKEKTGS
jgi:hypothetical protein